MRRRAFPLLMALCLLAGCGYVGDPRPPSLQIPPAPTAFGARQVGAKLLGEFTVGAMTLDDAPLRLAGGVVRIGARELPLEVMPGEVAHFNFESAEWAGQMVAIAARVRGATGRWSEWSNEITMMVEPAVAVPKSLTVQLAPKGVELRWEPATAATIERRLAGETAFVPLAAAMAPPYVDEAVVPMQKYEYRIQARKGTALSEPSGIVAITFADKFPPPVPTGLDGVAGLSSIELSWDAMDDPDFSAFVIYRTGPLPEPAPESPEFAQLGEPTALPSYSDRSVRPGSTYRYAIASVDRAGNISARSKPVDITLPPQ